MIKMEATQGMTPSEQAKALGCKNLKQVSDHIKKPIQTLINWHQKSPELFAAVCVGVANSPEIKEKTKCPTN